MTDFEEQFDCSGVSHTTNPLPDSSFSDTLAIDNQVGLYGLAVGVADHKGNADTLRLIGRNTYEALKYRHD
jgi:hypothetical protein